MRQNVRVYWYNISSHSHSTFYLERRKRHLVRPFRPDVGDLIQCRFATGVHIGIITDAQGIDIHVQWSTPINGLPGCSVPCTNSWLRRSDVTILSRA